MKLQVAFAVEGFLGSVEHTIEIDDKNGYDIKAITKTLNKNLKKEAVEQGTPNLTLKVKKILYSIQV